MKIDPAYINIAIALALGAVSWLFKVHYDLVQLKRDGRENEKSRVLDNSHYETEIQTLRTELNAYRAEAQSGHSGLKDALTKLELRIETGFTQLIEQMKTLFRDQEKQR